MRAISKSGECNVKNLQLHKHAYRLLQDYFHTLIDAQWWFILLCFILAFTLSWLGFGSIWWMIMYVHGDFEENHLPPFQEESKWTPCVTNIYSFTSVFLYSMETQHTTGFGSRVITEECPAAISLISLQSIAGVIIQTLMAGIVFAKMSLPKSRTQTILFSKNAVVTLRNGELCLMFRVGDMRKSHIIGATVRAQLIRFTKEGERLQIHQQELQIGTDGKNNNLFFIWPQIIIHKIDATSPFYHMTPQQMLLEQFEIVVFLDGTIQSTGQPTQARSNYLPEDILWGHQLETVMRYSEIKNTYEIDFSRFHKTRNVGIPQEFIYCSEDESTLRKQCPPNTDCIINIPDI